MGQAFKQKSHNRRFMHGMSLPEILAAVLIGLIGMVIIMQVYATSEERKRTTTGTSDAQINGNIALFTLETSMRSAGFGMVSPASNMLGCTTRASNSNRPTPDFSFVMAPVVICSAIDPITGVCTPPGAGSDMIRVIYGNSPNVVEGNAFVSAAASGTDIPLKNAAGVLVGDLVVAHESGLDCSVSEVTGFVPAAINTVQHATGATYSYVNSSGATVSPTATYNKAGGSGVDYSNAALLYTLGRSPTIVTYLVGSDKLQTKTLMPYVAAQDPDNDGLSDADIGDGIVQLKAQYGKDTDGDSVVDVWDTTLPATATAWNQVRAIRIAVLSRSGQYEKTVVTAAAPTWYGGTFTMVDPADGTDWHRYRYRVYETVVPLRNMIWSN